MWFGGGSGVGCGIEGLQLKEQVCCGLHSSEAALDFCLTVTLIISPPSDKAGAASLSPVLNHSISGAEGGEGA